MRTSWSALPCLVVVLAVLGAPSVGRSEKADPGVSLEIHGGYFTPVGDWTAHRYAEGVDQLRGGFMIGGEFEFPLWGLHWSLFYDYTRLDTSPWEEYAQSQGDDISASAAMSDFGLRIKHYLARGGPDYLNLHVGLGSYNMRGTESYAGRTYDYDFLQNGFGLSVGFGYKRKLGPQIALVLRVDFFIAAEGIKYADGESADVYGVPVTLGIGYLFR